MRMREILFRGKRIDNGEWVEGSLLIDGEEHKPKKEENLSFSKHYIVPETDRDNIKTRLNDGAFYLNTIAYHVIPETVGQFTGLTDKNGKKIFEGDIIQHGERKGRIFYYGNFGMFMISWISNGGANIFMNVLHTEVDVIGNIHDNPELIGGNEHG